MGTGFAAGLASHPAANHRQPEVQRGDEARTELGHFCERVGPHRRCSGPSVSSRSPASDSLETCATPGARRRRRWSGIRVGITRYTLNSARLTRPPSRKHPPVGAHPGSVGSQSSTMLIRRLLPESAATRAGFVPTISTITPSEIADAKTNFRILYLPINMCRALERHRMSAGRQSPSGDPQRSRQVCRGRLRRISARFLQGADTSEGG